MKKTKSLEVYRDCRLRNIDINLEVRKENHAQLMKWGVQSHTLPEWLMFIGEEVGEVNENYNSNQEQ